VNCLFRSSRAVPVGMMFHELATNAAKYGALSVPSGRINISWTVDRDVLSLHLQWAETGGPAVRTPTRRGFGSRLIERGLACELGADVHLTFNPDGVRCTMRIPLLPAEQLP
jgi:two-component sensor histidine kinase